MKKLTILLMILLSMSACSALRELSALSKCEYSFHSASDPRVADVDIMQIRSFSDLSFLDGQKLISNILQKRLPFSITANIEVLNPGTLTAAVNYIDWIAFIDDVQVSTGRIEDRIEIPANGGQSIIPISIESDLFEYLEGDNPKSMLNFALNLVDAGGQPTRLSLKIKPSIYIGNRLIPSPEYFTISKEFRSGN